MRLLANENIPGPVVQSLRTLGHDVAWAKEGLQGASDRTLLSRAQAEMRVIVTCDKDFGELAFHAGLPADSGIVLFRIAWTNPLADNAYAVSALTSRESWSGMFAVVEGDRIRVRPLPSVGPSGNAAR